MGDRPDHRTKKTHDSYNVLARKYRPAGFDALIGQEAVVRTLSSAIASDRVAHAFLLTGIRGVGKTTTARLIAKALNCVGPDGKGEATIEPCSQCEPCQAIAQSRYIDVLEMDAASHTGVDDIREIIETVKYAPAHARYKIYIIDEVHMLSRNAFNALLKTLEEPPAHVKFIFATTEARKIPVTILSRCQRFDLKRVREKDLIAHFQQILKKEGADCSDKALTMIVGAADGSVRDGLSLLDQAIVHSNGHITVEGVSDMLGLADRNAIFRLMQAILNGEVGNAFEILHHNDDYGAAPVTQARDLLELAHEICVRKLDDAPTSAFSRDDETHKDQINQWAQSLTFPVLDRLWQLLLKGIDDIQTAPSALQALEMLTLRLIHAHNLPDPSDIVKHLESTRHQSLQAKTHPKTVAEPSPAPASTTAPSPTSSEHRPDKSANIIRFPDKQTGLEDPNAQKARTTGTKIKDHPKVLEALRFFPGSRLTGFTPHPIDKKKDNHEH